MFLVNHLLNWSVNLYPCWTIVAGNDYDDLNDEKHDTMSEIEYDKYATKEGFKIINIYCDNLYLHYFWHDYIIY